MCVHVWTGLSALTSHTLFSTKGKDRITSEVNVAKEDDLNVYGSIDYVLGPSSKEDTPTKGRYVVVVEAKNHLQDHDRVQAFGEMKAALKKNKDDLTVYGVLTDAEKWCILSLGPDRVPRMSIPLQLGVQPHIYNYQLSSIRCMQCLYLL